MALASTTPRLACLTQLLDHSGELNVDPSVLLPVQQIALKAFRDDISDGTFQVPEDHTKLQAKLTSNGYQRLAAQALREADQWGKQSLISLTAVHATTWTTGCNPWISMSSEEFRFALRWILGVQVSRNACWCTFCGARQDQFGRHAVTCLRTGAITHYHNVLRDTVQAILIAAGYTTLREQALPSSPSLRPADLLVLGWKAGKPLALDFTVITPALNETPGSEIRVAASLLDLACAAKVRRYRAACERDGWSFQPFAADVFGALHPSARRIVEVVISKYERQHPYPLSSPVRAGQPFSGWAKKGVLVEQALFSECRISGRYQYCLDWVSQHVMVMSNCSAKLILPCSAECTPACIATYLYTQYPPQGESKLF